MAKIDTLKIRDIPSFPDILFRLNRVLTGKSITIETVTEIIEKDPALTARILKLANSSYYGLSYRVNTLKRAITVLGFNTIRNLTLTVSVFNMFERNGHHCINMDLWHHSLGCAIASKSLLCRMDKILQEKAFMCGILHDIGKLIIFLNLPDDTEKIVKKMKENRLLTQCEAENELIGFDHSDTGSLIAKKWHFPQELVSVINLHHKPENFASFYLSSGAITENRHETELMLYSVYAGNQIAKALALGRSSDPLVSNINPVIWENFDIGEKDLPSVLLNIKENFRDVLDTWNM